jgi:hypothetical protein
MRNAILAVVAAALCAGGTAWAQTKAPPERAVLYEENNTPQGARFDGTVIWSTEKTSPGPGHAAEPMVKAVITVPDRQLTATWSLQRNTDKTLPATHVIEVTFKLPGGGVDRMPGILMKTDEMTKGTPLSGLSVKVTANYFMFGLSAGETDSARNVALLKTLGWIDIPIIYSDGHRAILAVSKGESGKRAFDAAFAAWNNSPAAAPK